MSNLTIVLHWMPGVRFCSHPNATGPAPVSMGASRLRMMNTLGIASWVFLIGAMGQWAFYYRIFPRLPRI